MISVQDVSKSFGSVRALEGVSFEIGRRGVVGLLGPNGAGKTTMMRLITAFFTPSKGKVLIDGEDLMHSKAVIRKQVGYLAENNPLYKDMTTKDFLYYVATLKGISFTKRKQAVGAVVEQCEVGSVMKRVIGKLSKGFQQRVGLAQALLGSPKFLILDEPTTGLDPQQIIEIRSLIRKLGQEQTVLLSTHILPEVRMTCESILILNEGRLVARGTLAELERRLRGAQEFLVTLRGNWLGGDESGVLVFLLKRVMRSSARTKSFIAQN